MAAYGSYLPTNFDANDYTIARAIHDIKCRELHGVSSERDECVGSFRQEARKLLADPQLSSLSPQEIYIVLFTLANIKHKKTPEEWYEYYASQCK